MKVIVGRILGRKPGRSQTMRTESNPYKRMTPPSIQNLKALSLWVFFFICCSTSSFLPNVGLRLILEYLTVMNDDDQKNDMQALI